MVFCIWSAFYGCWIQIVTVTWKNICCESGKEMMMIIITIKTERVSLNIWWESYSLNNVFHLILNLFFGSKYVLLFLETGHTIYIFEVCRKRKFYVTPVDKFLFLTSAVNVFTIKKVRILMNIPNHIRKPIWLSFETYKKVDDV